MGKRRSSSALSDSLPNWACCLQQRRGLGFIGGPVSRQQPNCGLRVEAMRRNRATGHGSFGVSISYHLSPRMTSLSLNVFGTLYLNHWTEYAARFLLIRRNGDGVKTSLSPGVRTV